MTGSARRVAGVIAAAVALALLAAPAALAAGPLGSLSQLPSPNSCIGTNAECTATTSSITRAGDVVVSPDGKNVYVLSNGSVAEFARRADGSLLELGCTGTNAGCVAAVGLNFPTAIAISPDGNNVYVVGADSNNVGNIAEFARGAGGSLTQLTAGNKCIGESEVSPPLSACPTTSGHGLNRPTDVTVSPDGSNVYVTDGSGSAVAEFARAANGSLTELGCLQESGATVDCATTSGHGLLSASSLSVSPDGHNVYVGGGDTIATLTRNAGGSLAQAGGQADCIQRQGDTNLDCTTTGIGLSSIGSVAVSADGRNVYTLSSFQASGAVAEFARNANGSLTQLAAPNNCIEENVPGQTEPGVGSSAQGCGTQTGTGLGEGSALEVTPDGANVYVASVSDDCNFPCKDAVSELSRRADGSLAPLASPDDCIQESPGTECGTKSGRGIGGGFAGVGLAISPGGDSVYTAGNGTSGNGDVAEFARVLPTLSVSLAGTGAGTVSDGTGAISCAPTCSHAYPIGQVVTLTATAGSGSGFLSWSGGGCSGTATCQVTMTADTAVTATFNVQTPPTTVLTGAPPSIGGTTAGFTGSVNPSGLPTTASFEYGLDPKYTGGGPVTYTQSTPAQSVGSDFATHIVTASVSGLVPNATYHVRLVATNSAGTTFGPDVVFNTLRTAPPGAPALGKTFNVSVVSGVVLIEINGVFIPITELQQIPANTVINALHGTLTLTTALPAVQARDAAAKGKKKVKTQSGTFGGAIFKITQATKGAGKGLATLAIVEGAFNGAPSYATCNAPKKAGDASAAALSSKTLQLLHASAKGKFATKGKYSAATVRGTKWTIADRCDGTLTHDITHSVAVNDFVRHKTIILHAGQSYLAKPRK
jgi:DNA-binding beta-propeller fold protein YncE